MMLRYFSTAAALGAGWFVVLLLPGMTREWLLENSLQNLLSLVVASLVVAQVCRRFIAEAETIWEHLVRAIAISYFGSFVFLSLSAAWLWIPSALHGGLANMHDTMSLYAMGLMATTLSCFVVVPYGLLCQYLMNSAADWRPDWRLR